MTTSLSSFFQAKWTRNGEPVSNGGRFEIEMGDRHAILRIKRAEKEDDGDYKLVLENDLGMDTCNIPVQVSLD